VTSRINKISGSGCKIYSVVILGAQIAYYCGINIYKVGPFGLSYSLALCDKVNTVASFQTDCLVDIFNIVLQHA